MKKTWKPIAAGVLSIVGGALGLLGGLILSLFGAMRLADVGGMWGMWGSGVHMMPWGANFLGSFGLLGVILGIVAIAGGIFALRRRLWGFALAGAICAALMPASFILGILAVIFIALSHGEFD